jgi:hypothetical protein
VLLDRREKSIALLAGKCLDRFLVAPGPADIQLAAEPLGGVPGEEPITHRPMQGRTDRRKDELDRRSAERFGRELVRKERQQVRRLDLSNHPCPEDG